MPVDSLALAAAALLGVVVLFQLALVAGAPWGRMAYGGRAARADGRLPAAHRVGSAVTVLALAAAAWLLLVAGGVVDSDAIGDRVMEPALWILALLFAVNTLGNFAARHPVERFGFGAVTLALTVLTVLIAVNR